MFELIDTVMLPVTILTVPFGLYYLGAGILAHFREIDPFTRRRTEVWAWFGLGVGLSALHRLLPDRLTLLSAVCDYGSLVAMYSGFYWVYRTGKMLPDAAEVSFNHPGNALDANPHDGS
ncbi:MAG: hypothetical protein ABI039_11620 [Vicinamibacterales bacterium]